MVPVWYQNKEYDKIESYIRNEALKFKDAYKLLKSEIPKIKLPHEYFSGSA